MMGTHCYGSRLVIQPLSLFLKLVKMRCPKKGALVVVGASSGARWLALGCSPAAGAYWRLSQDRWGHCSGAKPAWRAFEPARSPVGGAVLVASVVALALAPALGKTRAATAASTRAATSLEARGARSRRARLRLLLVGGPGRVQVPLHAQVELRGGRHELLLVSQRGLQPAG